MRRLVLPIVAVLLVANLAWSQTPSRSPSASPPPVANPSPTPTSPKYRPILLGTGPTSLINQIDRQGLLAKGQENGTLMFCCIVNKVGKMVAGQTYRRTAGSKLLEEEVQKRLNSSSFVPAIYNYKLVDAIYYGTVVFMVANGKPRLRIFSNQDVEEIIKENDFIWPQPVFGGESKFSGFHYPEETAVVETDGTVELALTIDVDGNIKEMKVESEKPPFMGFGDAALGDFKDAKFIPAFRSGDPIESKIMLPVNYAPRPWL